MAKKTKAKKSKKALKTASPCIGCGAECCKYFAVFIDDPEDNDDLDAIKWYLHHQKVCVYIDQDLDWYVHVEVPCRQLDEDERCRIYPARPDVCRNYMPDACERSVNDVENVAEFYSVEEFEEFIKLNYRFKGTDIKRKYDSYRQPR